MADEPKPRKTNPYLDKEFAKFLQLAAYFKVNLSAEDIKKLNELKDKAVEPAEKFQNGTPEEIEQAKVKFVEIKNQILKDIILPKVTNKQGITDGVNGLYTNLIEKYERQNARERAKKALAEQAGDVSVNALVSRMKTVITDNNQQAEIKEIADKLKDIYGADANNDGKITLEELIKKLPKLDNNGDFREAFKKSGPEGFIKTDEFKQAIESAIGSLSSAAALPVKPKTVADAPSK